MRMTIKNLTFKVNFQCQKSFLPHSYSPCAQSTRQTSERGPRRQVRVCSDEGGPAHARGQLHEGRHELRAQVRLRHLGARLRGGADCE